MRWLASAVVVIGVLPAAGEPGPPPREVPQAPRVLYLGRYGYEQEGGRDPLLLRLDAGGRVIGDKPVELTDDDLKNIVTKFSDGHERVSVVIGVMDPARITLKEISSTIERVRKHVPAKTAVTFMIQDCD